MSDPHTAIAERLERIDGSFTPEAIKRHCTEAAQALRASADEVKAALNTARVMEKAADDALAERQAFHDRATQAEADLASARKALEPFAREADRIAPPGSDYIGDSCEVWQVGSYDMTRSRITYGNLRRAREVLRASTIGEEGEGSACTDLSALSSSAPQAQHSDGWLIEDNFIYSLVQDGWRKGEPVMHNRLMVNVTYDRRYASQDEARELAARLHAYLSGRTGSGPSPTPTAEEVGEIIYAANPMGDQETDLDGRPIGPGYVISWDDLIEYDAGIRDGILETANEILRLFQPEGRARSSPLSTEEQKGGGE